MNTERITSMNLNLCTNGPRRLRRAQLFAASLTLAGASACAPPSYVRLRSTMTVNARTSEPAEVVTARDGDRARGSIGRVAVIAPDECTNFSAASETGATTNAAVVIRQRCAVELATIERALAAAGYSVISWRQLRDRVDAPRDTERDPRSTALAAAQRFGAQALVDVNSLDHVTRAHGAIDARWERGLFASDRYGRPGEPLESSRFLPASLAQIEQHAEAAESELLQRLRRGAGLNLTVVSVEAGQTLFFYRRFLVEPYRDQSSIERLLVRGDNGYLSTVPEELPIEDREFSAFRPSVSISRVDRPDSVETATHYRLLDEVVNDCVAQMVARLGVAGPQTLAPPSESRRGESRSETRDAPPPPPPPLTTLQPQEPIAGSDAEEPSLRGGARAHRRRARAR